MELLEIFGKTVSQDETKLKRDPLVSSGFISYVKNGLNETGEPLH